jgi:hypothetical protein
MTPHDAERRDRAINCDFDRLESVRNAVRGLQSTDDPTLLPLHDALMNRLKRLEQLVVDEETKHKQLMLQKDCAYKFIGENRLEGPNGWYCEPLDYPTSDWCHAITPFVEELNRLAAENEKLRR